MTKRYLEFTDAKSSKFWEINVSGKKIEVRYGKIGTDGQSTVKELDTSTDAKVQADKLVLEKIKKGYVEGGDKPSQNQKKVGSTAPIMGKSPKAFTLEPEWQKCVTQVEYWKKNGLLIERAQLWRFGQIVIEAASESEVKKLLKTRDEQDRVCINDVFPEPIDQTLRDCISDDLYPPDEMPEKEAQKLAKLFRKNSEEMFEKEGWSIEETKLYFESDIKVTERKR